MGFTDSVQVLAENELIVFQNGSQCGWGECWGILLDWLSDACAPANLPMMPLTRSIADREIPTYHNQWRMWGGRAVCTVLPMVAASLESESSPPLVMENSFRASLMSPLTSVIEKMACRGLLHRYHLHVCGADTWVDHLDLLIQVL